MNRGPCAEHEALLHIALEKVNALEEAMQIKDALLREAREWFECALVPERELRNALMARIDAALRPEGT